MEDRDPPEGKNCPVLLLLSLLCYQTTHDNDCHVLTPAPKGRGEASSFTFGQAGSPVGPVRQAREKYRGSGQITTSTEDETNWRRRLCPIAESAGPADFLSIFFFSGQATYGRKSDRGGRARGSITKKFMHPQLINVYTNLLIFHLFALDRR